MSSRLLDAAEALLDARPRSAAFRRRAASTAYYAVFHALAAVCAGALIGHSTGAAADYARVYRALDHGPLRKVFAEAPLRERPDLRVIGDAVMRLQSERHRADYEPPTPGMLPHAEVKALIELARQTIASISALALAERRVLATSLLFRTR